MAANVEPIYSKIGDIQWAVDMTAGNNTADITTGTSYLVFTADATNGGFVREMRIKAQPGNNTAATVARVWINNGSTTGTSSNTSFFTETTIAGTTASATASLPDTVIPLNFALPPGYKLYLTFGTAPGGSGKFSATVIGGKY